MKLTALEIKQQQFEKSLRGYDVTEVNAFLSLVASEWEHMVGKLRDMENELDKLDHKLKHYERVESALHETLQTAKDSAEHKLVGAKKDAKNIIEKAELEADTILSEAKRERQHVRQSILRLIDRRDEIIRGIRSYLELSQESLQQFGKDDAGIYKLPNEDLPEFDGQLKENNDSQKKETQDSARKGDPLPPGAENLDDIIDEFD